MSCHCFLVQANEGNKKQKADDCFLLELWTFKKVSTQLCHQRRTPGFTRRRHHQPGSSPILARRIWAFASTLLPTTPQTNAGDMKQRCRLIFDQVLGDNTKNIWVRNSEAKSEKFKVKVRNSCLCAILVRNSHVKVRLSEKLVHYGKPRVDFCQCRK